MRSLVIISHTKHYYNKNGEIVGWEPTVREINHFISIFDIIYHVAPLYNDSPHKANIPYVSKNIILVPILPTGGKGFIKKMGILFFMPYNIFRIIRMIKKANWIHFRAPTNLGIFVLPLLTLYRTKNKWVKYAGNWKQKNIPCSYSMQRWWLKKNFLNSFVTINGNWKKQESHLLTFHNPCISNKEINNANKIGMKKMFSGKLNICFVGRLDNNKGLSRIVEVLKNIDYSSLINEFNIVGGDGDGTIDYSKLGSDIIVKSFGWLNRQELDDIYSKSHIIILPTISEGFPKVIAEAASFGCIPMVTNFAPINQYIIHNGNGFLLNSISNEDISNGFMEMQNRKLDLKNISLSVMKISHNFTFNNYIEQLENNILNA